MRILVCIISHEMNESDLPNIEILDKYMKESGNIVDYAGICSNDNFSIFERVIQFKYKFICKDRQLTKLCKFIIKFRSGFDYDWYIKIRPDITLLDQINFGGLNPEGINARVRNYIGPHQIKYGSSAPNFEINRPHVYKASEDLVILDDQIFLFHKNIINKFQLIIFNTPVEAEYRHSEYWSLIDIPKKVFGINVILTKYNLASRDLIPKRIYLFGLKKWNKHVSPTL
jgi:hypothetical protein